MEFGKKETFRMEGRNWIERWYLKGKLEFEKGGQGLKKRLVLTKKGMIWKGMFYKEVCGQGVGVA